MPDLLKLLISLAANFNVSGLVESLLAPLVPAAVAQGVGKDTRAGVTVDLTTYFDLLVGVLEQITLSKNLSSVITRYVNCLYTNIYTNHFCGYSLAGAAFGCCLKITYFGDVCITAGCNLNIELQVVT